MKVSGTICAYWVAEDDGEDTGRLVACGRCDRCQNEAEGQFERFCEDYYGGSGPVTVQEQYQQAEDTLS